MAKLESGLLRYCETEQCELIHKSQQRFLYDLKRTDIYLDYEKANFVPKGTLDGSNQFEIKGDCYNLKIQELIDPRYITKCTFKLGKM
jgi:hypothetical protein